MTQNRYLLDNSALIRLTAVQRAASLIRTYCRIPTEVLWEARGLPDHDALQALDYPMTPTVARWLRVVMAAIPIDSVDVIDLYQNKGNGDPILVAVALDARDASEQTLLPEVWHIVTADRGLANLAETFEIPTLQLPEFAALLD